MAGRRTSQGDLASLPSSSSVDLYESAEELSLPASRGNSFSGAQRRSADLASHSSSVASARGTADTASSPDPSRLGRPPSGKGGTAAAALAAAPADAAAEQLVAVSLDDAAGQQQKQQQQQQQQAAGEQGAPPVSPGALIPPDQREQQQQQQREQQQQGASSPPQRGSDSREAAAASAVGGSGAAPNNQLPPGASLFSVPMASAPTTGIYSIPQEMFRIRDLDAGKEYSLDQRYWIKDIDTGTVYVIEGDDAAAGGAAGAAGGAASEGRVTELLSGRELSLDEFEDALGFFKVPQPAPPPQHTLGGPTLSSSSSGSGVSGVQAAAQRSFKSFTSGATWMKASVGGMLSSLKPHQAQQQSSPRGGQAPSDGAAPMAAGAAAGGGFSGVERSLGSGGGAPPPLTSLDDRQGQPVKVQVFRKTYKEFTDLRLVQQLGGHSGVVWALKFSRNGRFLASAGQDCVVRVWEVAPTRGSGSTPTTPIESDVPLDDAAAAAAGAGGGGEGAGGGLLADPSVAVFQQRPYRVYRGHKQDVLDLCWSKTQFLLSASMDKTVRLWHVSMDECLRIFKHTDFVTAIDFHPLDDKMFLSGSIDGKVRLWNIPEQRVVSWQDVHEMVTAVAYSQDGRKAVVGTMKGKCRFYTIEKSALEYEAQLDVKNKRGQHARGKKVTGLAFLPADPGKLLITSNDSRVRLYDGYTLRCKYKGHTNRNTQIRASFSPGGDYITCGSDDGWVYIWGTRKSGVPPAGGTAGGSAASGGAAGGSSVTREADNPLAKEKNASYECFQANGDVVTVAVFAPAACHRAVDSFSPMGAPARHQRSDSLGDQAEGEAALAAARARGQVLVTAGYTGEIKIYENMGLPQWL